MTSVPISKFQLTNTLDRYCEPKSELSLTLSQFMPSRSGSTRISTSTRRSMRDEPTPESLPRK